MSANAATLPIEPWDIVRGRLDKVRGTDVKGTARCPAHEDRTPSLSSRVKPNGDVLLHCFAGCDVTDICSAVGLRVSELYASENGAYRPPPPGSLATLERTNGSFVSAQKEEVCAETNSEVEGSLTLPFAPSSKPWRTLLHMSRIHQ